MRKGYSRSTSDKQKCKKGKKNIKTTASEKCIMKNWIDTNKGPMSECLFDIFHYSLDWGTIAFFSSSTVSSTPSAIDREKTNNKFPILSKLCHFSPCFTFIAAWWSFRFFHLVCLFLFIYCHTFITWYYISLCVPFTLFIVACES